jgi:transposase
LKKSLLCCIFESAKRKEAQMKPKTIRQKGRYVKSDVLVVGVDISKTFHVAVAREPDGGFSKAYRFTSDAVGFADFKFWLDGHQRRGDFVRVLVGIESTSHYWITLVAWLQRRGIEVVQVNPLHTRKAKDLYDNTPSKTDKKDARIIADLVSQG